MRKAEMDEMRAKKQIADSPSSSMTSFMQSQNGLPIKGECGLCGAGPLELVLEVSFKV